MQVSLTDGAQSNIEYVMSYAYAVDETHNLVVLRFRGTISFSEEIEAIISVLKDPRIKPNTHVLIERTQASIQTDPAKIGLYFEIITESISGLGRPKIAVIVADEMDLNMMKLMQLQSEVHLNHDYKIFKNFKDALNWFEIEKDNIYIPDI